MIGPFLMKYSYTLASIGLLGWLYFSTAFLKRICHMTFPWQNIAFFSVFYGVFLALFTYGFFGGDAECKKLMEEIARGHGQNGLFIVMACLIIMSLCCSNRLMDRIPILISLPMSWVFMGLLFLVDNPCSPFFVPVGNMDALGLVKYSGNPALGTTITMAIVYVVMDILIMMFMAIICTVEMKSEKNG